MATFRKRLRVFLLSYKGRNDLFLCLSGWNNKCNRYFRRYQWELYQENFENLVGKCPHCLDQKRLHEYSYSDDEMDSAKLIKKADPWLDNEKDCPKVGFFEYWQLIKINLSKIEIAEQQAMMKRFEEYQKRENSQWIEKMRKKQKEDIESWK